MPTLVSTNDAPILDATTNNSSTIMNSSPMPMLVDSPSAPSSRRGLPSTSLTLSVQGVAFQLTPKDGNSQLSYKTTAHGEIVLDLVNFSGRLQVNGTTTDANTSATRNVDVSGAASNADINTTILAHHSSTSHCSINSNSMAKKVEEEPISPPKATDNVVNTVTPGQQKLTFGKKKNTKAKISNKKNQVKSTKRPSPEMTATVETRSTDEDGQLPTASTSNKKTKPNSDVVTLLAQSTMDVPTQNGAAMDFSQTMPSKDESRLSSSSSSSSTSGKDNSSSNRLTMMDENTKPKETVQEILDRVNNSSDSVADEEELQEIVNGPAVANEPNHVPMDTTTTTTTTVNGNVKSQTSTSFGYLAPCPRWGHTMTKLKKDRLLVYGGQSFDTDGNSIILSDVHVYDMQSKKWEKPINCRGEARQWHSVTFLPERQLLLAFGGETYDPTKKNKRVTTSDSLKVLDTEIMLWYPPAVSGDIPSGRSGHTATLIPTTNQVVLFGGVKGSKWLNTITILDSVRWIWSVPKIQGSAPKPRSYHSTTAVPSGDSYKLVVFGGNNKSSAFNTVHVLEAVGNDEWKWSNPATQGRAPFPRTGHSATLLEDGKTLCIYGGWDPNEEGEEGEENIFKTSFLLDTESWTWSAGPKVVSGGSGTDQAIENCGPKRCGHTATVHPETGDVLVFGGRIPGEILAGDFQRLGEDYSKE